MSDWRFKLFDCFSAPCGCVWSALVPCGMPCMQATTAKILVKEHNAHIKACLFGAFLCCFGAAYNRTKLREVLNIKGTYMTDCLLSLFCPCCSVVQEWRESMVASGRNDDERVWKAYNEYEIVE